MLPVIEITLPAQIPTSGGNVPAFLAKLWKMVNNPDADNLIAWGEDGNSFIIKNQSEFTKTMLPYYYKHSNMASFVRQLNMYGFHKVMSVDSGGLRGDREETEFSHTFFLRGQEHLLDQIKRKVNPAASKGVSNFVPSIKSEKVTEVLSEVGVLRERQEDLDNKLDNMRSENEALWGEVLSLRQKHHQQQKIVNKLIQFLSALLQPRGMKRSFETRGFSFPSGQLAIEDAGVEIVGDSVISGGPSPAKQPRLAPGDRGPVIQELPANLNPSQLSSVLDNIRSPDMSSSEPVVEIIIDQSQQASKPVTANQATPEIPGVFSKYKMVDPVSVNSSLSPLRPGFQRQISREDFDSVINNNEKDLDNLKDILSGQITLDTSLVSSLFTADTDPANLNLFNDFVLPESNNEDNNTSSETNVKPVTYNPSLFEDYEAENNMTPTNIFFDDENALHTPMIQEDQTDPLKKFFNK